MNGIYLKTEGMTDQDHTDARSLLLELLDPNEPHDNPELFATYNLIGVALGNKYIEYFDQVSSYGPDAREVTLEELREIVANAEGKGPAPGGLSPAVREIRKFAILRKDGTAAYEVEEHANGTIRVSDFDDEFIVEPKYLTSLIAALQRFTPT